MGYTKRELRVGFLTPAFLGNAEQSGQWRTPPFKHLLREWWRVAWAAKNDPANWKKMREVEAPLFGHAWWKGDKDKNGRSVSVRKSRVLLRIAPWDRGSMNAMPVTKPAAERAPQSAKYLAYGPEGELNEKPAISEGIHSELQLAWPDGMAGTEHLEETMKLIQAFGTLGGRSRNGWGSLWLDEIEGLPDVNVFTRPWKDCLALEWAHAIGRDETAPLIWTTGEPVREWTAVIESLAAIRKAVNAAMDGGARKVLNQPVAGRGGRVPSSLRFKVRRVQGGLQGVIFHMPCTPPDLARHSRKNVLDAWQQTHELLDGQFRRSSV
ncbi:hypothetical protein QVG61_06145 [Thiohalobacter sp. IOR34]|uniref:RAMP superfamily CRISPR-associated protein n=1 Tax=Thiohalobacter sp. IOR34 TaxID=3057176 RepID=UPI0025B1ECE9|nr:RAMP superfamily CRISPR-associated protein [Thiohalobacter sp. IOR34]WJW76665.1 hypothetical protein QVG61_06145 [Thiohalobacter sp. IOR34]